MPAEDQPIAQTPEWREAIETLVLLMAPSTPYVAEELWERLGMPYSVHHQEWPKHDEVLIKQETVELVPQRQYRRSGAGKDGNMLPAQAGRPHHRQPDDDVDDAGA